MRCDLCDFSDELGNSDLHNHGVGDIDHNMGGGGRVIWDRKAKQWVCTSCWKWIYEAVRNSALDQARRSRIPVDPGQV